jgi:hypothetical protein
MKESRATFFIKNKPCAKYEDEETKREIVCVSRQLSWKW